jgi:hypothetical protein
LLSIEKENALLRQEREILKKVRSFCKNFIRHRLQAIEEKYCFMLNHREEFSIEAMSMILNVSTSGYYEWLHQEPSKRQNENKMLLTKIENILALRIIPC